MDSITFPVHFFKIILSNITPHTTLMIPRKFTSKCGYDLAHSVYLRAPAGSVWKVEVERSSDDLWLGHGWPDFAANYSICFGHVLLFRYEGKSHFHVIILDKSATEIEYPSSISATEPTYINKGYQKRKQVATTSDNVGNMAQHRNCCRLSKKKKSVSACTEASRQLRDGETRGHENVSETLNKTVTSATEIDYQDANNNSIQLRKRVIEIAIGADVLANTEVGKTRAVASAQSFKSDNPFFTLTVSRSHLDGIHGAHVTKSFKESYKMWKSGDQAILLVAGSTWNVECKIADRGCRLANGWDKFAKDNLLIVGDVCVFELINPSIKLLQVSIFPAAKNLKGKEEKMLMRVTSENEETTVPAISAKAFESPFFKINMQPTHVSGQFVLSVPKKFIDRYISKDGCNVTLQVSDGRAWSVKCVNVSGRARFGDGWRTFVHANDLVVGDVCVFQLINQSEKLLNVDILRTE